MMFSSTRPWIVICDAPVGYQVETAPISDEYYEQWFEHHASAQAYADDMAAASGWDVVDRSTPDFVRENMA